jgi:hypothetical protein
MKIFIAAATTGMVHAHFAQAVFDIKTDLAEHAIDCHLSLAGGSDVVFLRNILAARFLEDPKATHLFFLDTDMSVYGGIVRRMIGLNKPVIGAIYPRKDIDWPRIVQCARTSNLPFDRVVAQSQKYILFQESQRVSIKDGMCDLDGVGMGATLIRRDVFEAVKRIASQRRSSARTRSYDVKGDVWGFFDTIDRGELDPLSEDFSFCRRVKQCGMSVTGLCDVNVGHVGQIRIGFEFAKSL